MGVPVFEVGKRATVERWGNPVAIVPVAAIDGWEGPVTLLDASVWHLSPSGFWRVRDPRSVHSKHSVLRVERDGDDAIVVAAFEAKVDEKLRKALAGRLASMSWAEALSLPTTSLQAIAEILDAAKGGA